jgi:hypothetical protein
MTLIYIFAVSLYGNAENMAAFVRFHLTVICKTSHYADETVDRVTE